MPQHEGIVLAFERIREAGHRPELFRIGIGRGTPSQHLMHVALVGDVEDKTVTR